MPPRRSVRASSSSRLFDGSSEAGGPLDALPADAMHAPIGHGMSPGPAKYSSTYGSPPTILPTRRNVAQQRYQFSSALNHVVDAVEQDNENDARERAEREAELWRQQQQENQPPEQPPQQQPQTQRQRSPAAASATGSQSGQRAAAREASRQSQDTVESVELVHERGDEEEAPATGRTRRSTRQRRAASTTPDRAQPVAAAAQSTPRAQQTSGPAARDFAEEERIFAESRILTPVLPTRTTGVVSKAASIVQNIINSTRRKSTAHDDPDEEAIRRAYPQFNFIRPRPDNLPAGTDTRPAPADGASSQSQRATRSETSHRAEPQEAHGATGRATAAAAMSTSASSGPAARRVGGKSVKSRIATPGPGLSARNRLSIFSSSRNLSQDELAGNGHGSQASAASRAAFGRRRAPSAQPQSAAEEQPQRRQEIEAVQSPTGPKGLLWRLAETAKFMSLGVTFMVFAAIAVRVFVISTSSAALYEGYRLDNRLRWYGSDWRSNLRQLVPFALVHPLGAISDEEFARMNGLILSHASEVAQMQHTQRLHKDALDRVNNILPAMVHMELDRRGRPVISQEFWHALKDTIQADKDIFSLIWQKDGSMTISDLQWTALKRRLEAAGMLPDPNKKALSVMDVEAIADARLPKSWESWVRLNRNKVQDMLGVAPNGNKATAAPALPFDYGPVVDRLTDDQIVKLAQQVASSAKAKEVLVSRQDFLRHLQNAFVEHRLQVKGEIADLEARVFEIARTAAAAAAAAAAKTWPTEPSPPSSAGVVSGSLTKQEVMAMVDQLVRKGITDAQLEALARAKIKLNWDAHLINQVNFFSRNGGALVNHHLTSPAFTAATSPLGGSKGRPLPGSARGMVAIEPWEQDGDCWCAATRGGQHGRRVGTADIAVKLGMRIVPQHLVVEHISSSATLDPGSMPKDLEVWIQITDYALKQPLRDWSASQYSGRRSADGRDDYLAGWGFYKVGVFQYEAGNVSGNGGAQVFRLSPDLEALGAVTDHVVVRATSNYGSSDHTCFYRVRMYGQLRPDGV